MATQWLSYISKIERCIKEGHAEPVPKVSLNHSDGKVWYVPHYGVKHPIKDKIRAVFDLKAKYRGECPATGTQLNQ